MDTRAYIRWGLCILCVLLIGALISSYYLQVKKIRAVHETVVSIFAGMVVGLIIRLSPGHLIREMLVGLLLPFLGYALQWGWMASGILIVDV
jgi:sodium/hydrogen exchanger-like protein 6/7